MSRAQGSTKHPPSTTGPPGMTKPKRPPGKKSTNSRGSSSLRDPTVHELHNGPDRTQLPETVRNNSRSETVCKFCGVSYLVFSEIKELEKRLASAEEQLIEHRRKAQQFDVLQKKVHQLVAAQQQQQQDYEKLQRRSANLEACVYEREEALGRAQTEVERMRSKVSGVRGALARERINVENLKMKTVRTLGDMATLMKSTQHEIGVVGTRLKREEEWRIKAESELAAVRAMLASESATSDEQDQNIAELRKAMELLERQWKEEVEHLKKQQEQLITSLKEEQHKQMQACKENAQTEIKDVRAQHATEISNMEKEFGTLQEKYNQYEKQIEQERTISKEQVEKIQRLEKELGRLQNEGSASTKQLQKQLDDLRRQHERLKMIHEMDKKKLNVENNLLKEKTNEQQKELTKKEKAVQALTKTNQHLDGQVVDLLAQLKDAQNELLQLKNSVGNSTNENQEEIQRINEMHKKEIKKLHDLINNLTNELSDAQSTIDIANNNMQTVKSTMKKMQSQMQRTIDNNMNEIGILKSKVASSQGINDHLKTENIQLKKDLLTITDAKDQAVNALVEANLARERAERKAEDANEANVKLTEHLSTSEDTIAKLRHALAMKKEENDTLKYAAEKKNGTTNVDQETVDGIEMLEKHLIKLSEKLRKKNQEVEQLQAVIHRECIQRGRLMDELSELRR